eukprot:COSAG02_NODE_3944_length_6003_cov_3.206978_3_plen_150_part_00
MCVAMHGSGLLVGCGVPLCNGHVTRSVRRVQEVETNLDEKEGWHLLAKASQLGRIVTYGSCRLYTCLPRRKEPSIHPFLEQDSVVVHLINPTPSNDGDSGPVLRLLFRRQLQDSVLPVQIQVAAESICTAVGLWHIGCHLGFRVLRTMA